jgi:hypothetical protein
MKLTKTKLKQIIKEELQKIVEGNSLMDQIMSLTPGTPEIKAALTKLADATNTGGGYGDEAQETLIALKKQYVPKGTPTINFHEIAAAVYDNMTRG